MITMKNLAEEELLLKGNSACAGCGATLAIRWILKVLGDNVVLVSPAGCVSVFQGMFPFSAFNVPMVDSAFGAQSSVSAGLAAAFRVRNKKIRVVTIAGDGATADIGFHAVSAAAERGDDILYICYDNEAYMNTGVQRSGLTPFGARTRTTLKGKHEWKKDLPLIMAAHNIPYLATMSVGYPMDLFRKVEKASKMSGFRYLHVLAPCPPGWGTDESKTVELGRLAVRSCIWPLFEVENGKLTLTKMGSRVPVKDYLHAQRRFEDLGESQIQMIQDRAGAQMSYLERLEKIST